MKQRQLNIQRTPLPIESVFFQDDGATNTVTDRAGRATKKKIEDPVHWNRYYFDYPPEWITSDTGEDIIGVRSLWLLNKQRHIQFTLSIRKYAKVHFLAAYNNTYHPNPLLTEIQQIDALNLTDEQIDEVVSHLNSIYISAFSIPVDVTIKHDEDLRKIGEYIESYLTKSIEQMNSANSGMVFNDNPHFIQESMDVKFGNRNKDITFDETYSDDERTFKIVFSSPRNTNKYSENQDDKNLDCYVDIAIVESEVELRKKYDARYKLLPEDNRGAPYNHFNDDVKDLFNIGYTSYKNSGMYFMQFHRKFELKNLWDRHTCKVYASFANQSNHYYVGNSHVLFTPIKYYKLNSRDNRFWIEFYSARNPNIPIRLPEHEGFVLEMQFMQNDKLLYV